MSGLELLAALGQLRDHPAKAARRRSYAIHGYVGANGSGKSLALVHDTLPSLTAGRPCLSSLRLLDFLDPHLCGERPHDVCDDPEGHDGPLGVHRAPHPCYRPLRDFRDLVVFSGGDVLLDEVTGIASSRDHPQMPSPVVNWLVQLRRRDVLLRWTTPAWPRADRVMREVTQALTVCRGFAPQDVSDGQRLWRDRRVFRWHTFDAFAWDEWTTAKADRQRPLVKQWFVRPGSLAELAYDTRAPVLALGLADGGGLCMVCGGRRRSAACSCPDQARLRSVRRGAEDEGVA